jgi:hypothetical protein
MSKKFSLNMGWIQMVRAFKPRMSVGTNSNFDIFSLPEIWIYFTTPS